MNDKIIGLIGGASFGKSILNQIKLAADNNEIVLVLTAEWNENLNAVLDNEIKERGVTIEKPIAIPFIKNNLKSGQENRRERRKQERKNKKI